MLAQADRRPSASPIVYSASRAGLTFYGGNHSKTHWRAFAEAVRNLDEDPEGLAAGEALKQLEASVTLSEYEAGFYEKGGRRFDKIVRFARAGARTLREIATALNARGIPTARGGRWHAMTVRNVLART
jgi:hypothetical protein